MEWWLGIPTSLVSPLGVTAVCYIDRSLSLPAPNQAVRSSISLVQPRVEWLQAARNCHITIDTAIVSVALQARNVLIQAAQANNLCRKTSPRVKDQATNRSRHDFRQHLPPQSCTAGILDPLNNWGGQCRNCYTPAAWPMWPA